MGLAVISGLGSGALHAVTGPDHLLSLAPLAIENRRRAGRLGLVWGVGHGIGTLMLGALLLLFAAKLELSTLAAWGERLAGVALIVMGVRALLHAEPSKAERAPAREHAYGSVLAVGLLHGVTGAAALLLLLPAALASQIAIRISFLVAFALGSALAMAGFTVLAARTASRAASELQSKLQRVAGGASVLVGAAYVLSTVVRV